MPRTDASVSTRVVSWNEAAEMNELGRQNALVMPSSNRLAGRRACRPPSAFSLASSSCAFDLLAAQEAGVAGVGDLDLAQHLANDHLDVLVVDLHALQAVDVLDLVDQVGRQLGRRPSGAGCRAGSAAVGDRSPLPPSPLEHVDAAPFGNQRLVLLAVRPE